MKTVVVDPITSANLGDLSEPLEMRDPHGNLLGYFAPAKIDDADKNIPFSEEEIQALRHQSPGRRLREILHDLDNKS